MLVVIMLGVLILKFQTKVSYCSAFLVHHSLFSSTYTPFIIFIFMIKMIIMIIIIIFFPDHRHDHVWPLGECFYLSGWTGLLGHIWHLWQFREHNEFGLATNICFDFSSRLAICWVLFRFASPSQQKDLRCRSPTRLERGSLQRPPKAVATLSPRCGGSSSW